MCKHSNYSLINSSLALQICVSKLEQEAKNRNVAEKLFHLPNECFVFFGASLNRYQMTLHCHPSFLSCSCCCFFVCILLLSFLFWVDSTLLFYNIECLRGATRYTSPFVLLYTSCLTRWICAIFITKEQSDNSHLMPWKYSTIKVATFAKPRTIRAKANTTCVAFQ